MVNGEVPGNLTILISHLTVQHGGDRCDLANHGRELKIKADSSDVVLLPCYCTDLNTTQRFLWRKIDKMHGKMTNGTVDGKRVQQVVGSPGNFSLLITNLTVGDEGLYRCENSARKYTDVHLIVNGSTRIIPENESTIHARAGSSTLLPCHSTDLITTPEQFRWRKYTRSKATWEDMSCDGHKFKLVTDRFSGNLSLHISHLSQEDEGVYRCDLGRDKYTDVKLVVTVSPEPLPFYPIAMVTVIFLHAIVAGVYCTTRKKVQSRRHDNEVTFATNSMALADDCTLLDNMKTEFITAHEGSSVLLSCSCTDIHSKPATFMWKKKNPGKSTWEVILSESESNRKQIRLLNTRSPGNLSLLVSHLTEEDEGVYICFVERNQYRYMRLTVKAVTGKNMVYFPIATFAAIIFHIVIIVYVIKEDKILLFLVSQPLFQTLLEYTMSDEAVSLQ
ncbi:uncharacterized protein LOC113649524 [Tachysurus ichikawai]